MKNTYEIHITRLYIVRADDSEKARKIALDADIGASSEFEFGGMKITTIKNNAHKYVQNGVRSEHRKTAIKKQGLQYHPDSEYAHYKRSMKQEERHGKTTGRRDRNAGKEHEYINFSASDGV